VVADVRHDEIRLRAVDTKGKVFDEYRYRKPRKDMR
jgi:hypothetical protein